jgi:hypothetical protein
VDVHHSRRLLSSAVAVTLLSGLLLGHAPARADAPGTVTGDAQLVHQAVTVLASAGLPPASTDTESPADYQYPVDRFIPSRSAALTSQDHLPSPSATAVSVGTAGFDGVSQRDQQLADGGHNRTAPTADLALCVGNGFVLEGVRYALRVFDTHGTALSRTVALGPLFGDGHEVVSRQPLVWGPLHSAPRCLFDQVSGRFLVTAKRFHVDPATGRYDRSTAIELAVSRTGDPRGAWDVYSLDTTADGNHGSPALPGCPCYPELPNIGADAHGLFIGTSLVTIDSLEGSGTKALAGTRLFALSRQRLMSLSATRAVSLTLPAPDDRSTPSPVNPQPAIVPPGGSYDESSGGTEYFVADCLLNGKVFLLALSNTRSLDDPQPQLVLALTQVGTEPTYDPPLGTEQADGPRPLASWIQQQQGGAEPPLEMLLSGPRCEQLYWAAGRLWTSNMTAVKPPHGPVRSGIAWLQLVPSVSAGAVTATIANQGYVVVDDENATYGALAVDRTGRGVLVFALAGPGRYPSAAYASIDESGTGSAVIVAQGTSPYDTFAGYQYFGSSDRLANWGLYSGAQTVGDGDFWIGVQYVGRAPRSQLTNWGTRLAEVQP